MNQFKEAINFIENKMKILIIFPGKIGDALFMLPTIKAIRRKYPQAEIIWAYHKTIDPLISEFVTQGHKIADQYFQIDVPLNLTPGVWGTEWSFPEFEKKILEIVRQQVEGRINLIYNLTLTETDWTRHTVEDFGKKAGVVVDNKDFLLEKNKDNPDGNILLFQDASFGFIDPRSFFDYEIKAIKERFGSILTIIDKMINFHDLCNMIRESLLVIGASTGGTVIAAALGKPTITVHKMSRPDKCGISIVENGIDLLKPEKDVLIDAITEQVTRIWENGEH